MTKQRKENAMSLFNDAADRGGVLMSRREILMRIEDLYGRIDDVNEHKEELMCDLARTNREEARLRSMLDEMEALLH